MNFQAFIEILGTMAFAFSGAFAAMQKRLDIFGVLVLTFATAIGGGTIRDMLIGSFPVAWLNDLQLIYTLIAAYLLALLFSKRIIKLKHTLFWFDTLGLAFYCVVAITKGISFNLNPIICIALGTITGSFGGIIRDVLLNRIPYVFRKDVYASACIAAGVVYFLVLKFNGNYNIASTVAGLLIILIRVGAFYGNWRMPNIYLKQHRGKA